MDLGVTTISYDDEGNIKEAYFKPTMVVALQGNLFEEFKKEIASATDPEVIQHGADIVLASFFSQVTDIELADREEYHIKSEVLSCTKWPNGNVRLCKIKYSFVKL